MWQTTKRTRKWSQRTKSRSLKQTAAKKQQVKRRTLRLRLLARRRKRNLPQRAHGRVPGSAPSGARPSMRMRRVSPNRRLPQRKAGARKSDLESLQPARLNARLLPASFLRPLTCLSLRIPWIVVLWIIYCILAGYLGSTLPTLPIKSYIEST